MHGMHGRRRSGPGEEFWQYRHYAAGDDAAAIDWRKSARSHKVLVRENEWMAANTLWLWAQTDAGMGYRSEMARHGKAHRAALIVLALAGLAIRGGERAGALGAPWRPGHSQRTLERLFERIDPDAPRVREALPPLAEVARFSTCVLVGDFFAPLAELEERIRALAARGARGHLLQVVDPAEEAFPFSGRTRFEDFGSDEAITLGRAEALRDDYRRRLAAHREALEALCRRIGWTFQVHRTDQPPGRALMALHGRIEGRMEGRLASVAANAGLAGGRP